MYNRDFGGIKSEGQLYNYEREYNESRQKSNNVFEPEDNRTFDVPKNDLNRDCEKKKGLSLNFIRDLKLDDLILIGIGILLLLDSDGENDIFVLLIALLLFF